MASSITQKCKYYLVITIVSFILGAPLLAYSIHVSRTYVDNYYKWEEEQGGYYQKVKNNLHELYSPFDKPRPPSPYMGHNEVRIESTISLSLLFISVVSALGFKREYQKTKQTVANQNKN